MHSLDGVFLAVLDKLIKFYVKHRILQFLTVLLSPYKKARGLEIEIFL